MKTQTDGILDSIVHALQNLPTFNIQAIVKGVPTPWLEVVGPVIAEDLVIRESRLALDVMTVSVKIYEWGVLSARAQRVWEIEQRRERTWKAKLVAEKLASGEKLTEKAMEAIYRADAEYDVWKERVEAAAEAVNGAHAILDAFRAKAQMLRASIRPAMEGMNPTFSVP